MSKPERHHGTAHRDGVGHHGPGHHGTGQHGTGHLGTGHHGPSHQRTAHREERAQHKPAGEEKPAEEKIDGDAPLSAASIRSKFEAATKGSAPVKRKVGIFLMINSHCSKSELREKYI